MILRKPFKILIKYFKFIHLILMMIMIYITISSNRILSFLSEYLQTTTHLIEHETFLAVFKNVTLFAVIAIIVINLVLMSLMALKKKPIKFYIFSSIVYIYTLIIIFYARNTIGILEINLVDIKTLKVIQDLLMSAIILQSGALIFVAMRATGFDYKKFNFVKDLEEIKIVDEDNEEFEVNLDIDTDKTLRKFRKFIRYVKYLYVENKYIFSIGILLFVSLISFTIYLNLNIYNKPIQEKTAFRTNEYILNIKNSYITKKDYYGNTIDKDYQFVIIEFDVKQFTKKDKTFNVASIPLYINDHKLYHTVNYKTEFSDIGTYYNNDLITTDFSNYILIYKIPNSYVDDKMVLKFYDNNLKIITINLKPKNLNKEKNISQNNIGEDIVISDESSFRIDSFDISNVFNEEYQYCNANGCYNSVEYVKPSLTQNQNQDLLKLTGDVKFENNISMYKNMSLYKFIKSFGSIVYTLNGEEKVLSLNVKEVKPSKVYDKMKTYLEIPTDIKNSDSIILKISLRNKVYNCVLK